MTEFVAPPCVLSYILSMTSTSLSTLQITVNGAPHALRGATVADLVAEMVLDPRAVAVERNQVIVARSSYKTTLIMDGDAIEIVSFIGGG